MKNYNGFQRNRSTTSQILIIRRIIERVRAKNLEATLFLTDFSRAFDSIMEQILLAYILLKKTVTAIMMRYKDKKSMVRSPNIDSFFDIIVGVLQG